MSVILKSKNKGFLLLEVMLAVTILSLGLVFVLRSFVSCLRAIKLSHNLFTANVLLEEKIWQQRQQQYQWGGFIPQDEEGKFRPPFDNFSYKINFQEQEDLPALYKCTFAVSWQQRETDYTSSCVTYARSKEE